jgi:tetrahydromethanopterin S-methyltransferase subunit B
MKFNINVECTAHEAREFIGLPNVAPMQERLMEDLEKHIRTHMKSLDPQTLMKTWVPATIESLSVLQRMFMNQMAMGQPNSRKD